MVPLAELFWTYFRIGLLGFGGPFSLVSLQQKAAVDKKKWLTEEEFAECLGIGSLTPGPISSGTAAVTAYRLRGFPGAAVAYFAFHLPAVVLVIVLAATWHQAEALPWVQGVLRGVGAAVVGVLCGVALNTGRSLIKDLRSGLVAGGATLALAAFGVNPILVMAAAALTGVLLLRPGRKPEPSAGDTAAHGTTASRTDGGAKGGR